VPSLLLPHTSNVPHYSSPEAVRCVRHIPLGGFIHSIMRDECYLEGFYCMNPEHHRRRHYPLKTSKLTHYQLYNHLGCMLNSLETCGCLKILALHYGYCLDTLPCPASFLTLKSLKLNINERPNLVTLSLNGFLASHYLACSIAGGRGAIDVRLCSRSLALAAHRSPFQSKLLSRRFARVRWAIAHHCPPKSKWFTLPDTHILYFTGHRATCCRFDRTPCI
jgi:hypothetical protein